MTTTFVLQLMLERSLQHHQQRSVPNSETQRKAEEAAKAIIRIGDGLEKEYEDAKLQAVISESQIADGEILARFKKIINDLRPNLSWKMVVKLFRLGLRLFQTVTGNDHHRQQLELLMALLGFFRRELSSWIKEQGGWVSLNVQRDRFVYISDMASGSRKVLNLPTAVCLWGLVYIYIY